MTGRMKYGDIALGVECALPAGIAPIRRASRASRIVAWLAMALARRA
ncbi:MAG TPA: hypothetical protein VIF38_15500 [Burkholderiales bacterium]|jgi:hypothetical protein